MVNISKGKRSKMGIAECYVCGRVSDETNFERCEYGDHKVCSGCGVETCVCDITVCRKCNESHICE